MKYVQFNSNIIKLSILILFFSFTGSCSKDDVNVVPFNQVNLKLDMTSELASMYGAGSKGTFVTITPDSVKGSGWCIIDYHDTQHVKVSRQVGIVQNNGIIIYHSIWGEYGDYLAFDLTCPYNAFVSKPAGDCALNVNGRLSLPICPCCNSVFDLENGGLPSSGNKARHSLIPYKVSFSIDDLTMYVTK